jgi:hypothetical protein
VEAADNWQRVYDDAQQRKADEAKRAEEERLRRDAARLTAE